MIDNGYKLDVQTIKDEKLSKAVSEYQQYADAARQAKNTVAELNRSLVELYDTWAKAPAEEAEKQIERLTKGINGLEAAEARLDAVSKGGSTQAQLDKLIGRGTAASYSNLSGAGLRAVKIDNANKTAYYQKAYNNRNWAAQETRNNQAAYRQIADRIYGTATSTSSSSISS
jgi:hypothetical protein